MFGQIFQTLWQTGAELARRLEQERESQSGHMENPTQVKELEQQSPLAIKTNQLLAGDEPSTELEEAREIRQVFMAAGGGMTDVGSNMAQVPEGLLEHAYNMAQVPERLLERVYRQYGGAGLFRLQFLAGCVPAREFEWHLTVLEAILALLEKEPFGPREELRLDNTRLLAGSALASLWHNCFQPSLARKLYNAGEHHGKLTYGLGGPRILVSHPFRGGWGEAYGAYQNSLTIALALVRRGFHGRLLFLDNLLALNRDVNGHPAWLLWFSLIATHSDLVVYVTEEGEDLSDFQRMEVEYTPDLTQKKLVSLYRSELLPRAERDEREVLFIARGEGAITAERFREIEIEKMGALPLLSSYTEPIGDRAHLYVITEDKRLLVYSADTEVFR